MGWVAMYAWVVVSASAQASDTAVSPTPAVSALLSPWAGPFGGQPAFDKVDIVALRSALEIAMRQTLAEVQAIAKNPAPPTFENTLLPLEKSGDTLRRVQVYYSVWQTSKNLGAFPALERDMEPRFAALQDRIAQDPKLFARIESVYRNRNRTGLTAEQQQLAWLYWERGVKQGAALSPHAKSRLTAINQELSRLSTLFSQNILADESDATLYLKESDLSGLPLSVREAAASAAAESGHPHEFAILNTRSSVEPFLTYSDRRDLRDKVWRTFYSRGDNNNSHNNVKVVVPHILALRYQKARLLGFPNYAAWKLQDQMAKKPATAMALMLKVWPSVVQRIREDVAAMQALADAEHAGLKIAAWDYRYYAERLRKSHFDVDMSRIGQFLRLGRIRDAMFWVAHRLYGFTFSRFVGASVFDSSVEVYEVKDRDERHVGLWYFDPYARAGKASGAWMALYRAQQRGGGVSAIASNNANFEKSAAGIDAPISWNDAVTMFHEFGHALHALNSNVTYRSLASPNQAQDFVEFPAELNENWLLTSDVLMRFALDAQGQAIPSQLVDKLLKSSTFNQGFEVGEYLAAAIIDMKLHTLDPVHLGDIDAYEKTALAKLGMPPEVAMRHRISQFSHIFADEGYAAGYYAYLWAEVLAKDAYVAFNEASGPFDAACADRLKRTIMQVGYSVDPVDAFQSFRGRDPLIGPYLRSKAFPE